MSTLHRSVNPHPAPDSARLAQIHERILHDQIVLRRAGDVPSPRLRMAGVPPLVTLEAERRRRESARPEAQR